jgi:hypothetical protein
MSDEVFKIKSAGYFKVEIEEEGRIVASVRLDLWRLQVELCAVQEPEIADDPESEKGAKQLRVIDKTVDILEKAGLPRVSHADANAIRAKVFELTGTAKKNTPPAALPTASGDSPTGTALTAPSSDPTS